MRPALAGGHRERRGARVSVVQAATLGEPVSVDDLTSAIPHWGVVGWNRHALAVQLLRRWASRGPVRAVIISSLRPSPAIEHPVFTADALTLEIGRRHVGEGLALLRDATVTMGVSAAVLGEVDQVLRAIETLFDGHTRAGRMVRMRLPPDATAEDLAHTLQTLRQTVVVEQHAEPRVAAASGEWVLVGEALQLLADHGAEALEGHIDVHVPDLDGAQWLLAEGLEPVVEEGWRILTIDGLLAELRADPRYARATPEALYDLASDLADDRRLEMAYLHGGRRNNGDLAPFSVHTVVQALRQRAAAVEDPAVQQELEEVVARLRALTSGAHPFPAWQNPVTVVHVDPAQHAADTSGVGRPGLIIHHLLEESGDPEWLDERKVLVVDVTALPSEDDRAALVRACRLGRKTHVTVIALCRRADAGRLYWPHVGHVLSLDPVELGLDDSAVDMVTDPATAAGRRSFVVGMADGTVRPVDAWYHLMELEQAAGLWEGETR